MSTFPIRFGAGSASFAVATRLGIPLYTDDRYIRVQARTENIRTFGTLAVLDALVERGRLDESEREEARARLISSGAFGVLRGDDTLRIVEAHGWRLPESVRGQMLDPASWRDPLRAFRSHNAVVLLALAWATEEASFVQALISALRKLPTSLGWIPDPVPLAFDLLMSFGEEKPPAFRSALLSQVLRKLACETSFESCRYFDTEHTFW